MNGLKAIVSDVVVLYITLCISGVGGAVAAPRELAPGDEQIVAATADGIAVRVREQKPALTGQGHVFVIEVEHGTGDATGEIEIPVKNRADEMFVEMFILKSGQFGFSTRSIARPHTASNVSFIDTTKMTTYDKVFMFYPVVSPDGRYIVFHRFFYPHGLPSMWTLVILVYDTERTPEQNRIQDTGNPPEFFAGLPVYPQEYLDKQVYLLEDEGLDESKTADIVSPFLWAEDSSFFLFFASYPGRTVLVKVDVSLGLENARISEKTVDTEPFLREDLTEAERWVALKNTHLLQVWDFRWDGPHHIIVEPGQNYSKLKEEFRMQIPD